jgi:hypothetical protein
MEVHQIIAWGSHLEAFSVSSLTEHSSIQRADNTGAIGYVRIPKLHGNRRMSGVNTEIPGGGHLSELKRHQS